ncbi:MAG: ABC transporter permease subunit [Alphaproteobacteria bacterium]|nr:ABC transporter permease subunit [Alphaproteobacteria bacterium]
MDDRVAAAWERLPGYLSAHVGLSAAALALGVCISLPLAIAAHRSALVRWPALTGAGIIQTIPSLALLALFYPLLLALSSLSEQILGVRFSALGFWPSLLALTLYSVLPILRNAVAGLQGVDADVREAALGVGMTQAQRLWRVDLPLAAPVIMAGVRTAAVWVIGTATLSTPVGQTSLGNYIFTGLQTENWVFVLFGCIAAAALALIVDQVLALIESGVAKRDRRRVIAGAAALALGTLAALAPSLAAPRASYVIGAKTFTEQFILAQMIGDRLEAEGLTSTRRTGLGSSVAFRALSENEIDAYVDYSGTIWTTQMGRTDQPGRQAVLDQMAQWLRETHGIVSLGSLGFENAYALAMRRDEAERLGVRTITDLARVSTSMKIGGDFEFFARPEWTAIRDAYGLRFADQREYQSTFMYRAVGDGDVDVISAFSSDGRIAAFDLVVLEDDRGAIPPYDAVLLVAPARANDQAFLAALRPLIGAIDVSAMRQASLMVDREDDKRSVRDAAAFLAQEAGEPSSPARGR